MPKIAPKPTAAVKPTPAAQKPVAAPAAPSGEKKVLYHEAHIMFCVRPERKVLAGMKRRGPLTAEDAKQLLGWESEEDYSKRRAAESGQPEDKCKFPTDMDVVPFQDVGGANVVCWNNHHNRPFDREHALKLAQDILSGAWRFNMENAIISALGTVLSAQHRLVGLVFADQLWRGPQKLHWQSICKTPPSIECCIAFGCEESAEVLTSLDNVKPRSESDVIYTSKWYADLNHAERKECSRMQAAALDLLWKRTAAGTGADVWNKYKTNSTALDFLDRHKRLVECVRHLFDCNKGRAISLLKVSPGQCAAMQYMMAAGKSDELDYDKHRSEEGVSFELWDEAAAFWDGVADNDNATFKPLREGLRLLVDPDEGLGGRLVEKIALVALAWRTWLDNGGDIQESDLLQGQGDAVRPRLQYSEDRKRLLDAADFSGIDKGYKPAGGDPEVSAEELEQSKKEEREALAKRQQELVAKKAAAKPAPKPAAPSTGGNGVKADVRGMMASAQQAKIDTDMGAEKRRLALGGKPAAPAPAAKPAPAPIKPGLGQFKRPAGK